MRSLRRDQLRFAARSINIPISTLIDQACRQSHRGRGWRLDFGKCLPKPEKLPKRKPNMESIFGNRHLVRHLDRHLDCTNAVCLLHEECMSMAL